MASHLRRRAASIVSILAAAAVLAACGSSGAGGGNGANGVISRQSFDDDAAKSGGTLTFLEYQAPTCLYAGGGGFYPNATIINQIGDKLTYQDPDTREITPWLATSWEINADATQYTFHLRDDVTFSNGDPLDASVVALNFDHFGLGDKGLGLASQEFISNYVSSEVVDPHTVRFAFSAPSPGFLQATSVVGAAIVAKQTASLPYEQQCQLSNWIASGPFTVSKIVPDQEFTLTARPDYAWGPAALKHQGRAYLDAIHIVVTPEDSVRIGALKSGQGDILRTIQAYDEKGVQNAGFRIYAAATNGVNPNLSLRVANPRLAELPVRQALLKATDTQSILSTLFSASYPAATSILSHGATGYVDLSDKLGYDVDGANKLLDQAGWVKGSDGIRAKNGLKLELTTFTVSVFPQSQQTLELIAQQWLKIGVKLDIEVPDAATQTQRQKEANDIGLIGSHVGRVDPDVLKSAFWSKGSRNSLLSNDATLDALLTEISTLPTTQERYAKAAEAQNYLLDNALTIPLYELPQTYAAASYVHGVGWEAVGRIDLYSAWLDK